MSGPGEVEIARLRARNDELRDEVGTLRAFMDQLQALVEAIDHPGEDGEIMAALAASLEGALTVLDAGYGELLVLDEERDELVRVLAHGAARAEPWQSSPADAGMAGWVLQRIEPIIANDAPSDDRYDERVDQPGRMSVESLLVVPVLGSGKAVGVLRIVNKRAHGMFDENAQTLVSLMGRFAGELLVGMASRHEAAPRQG